MRDALLVFRNPPLRQVYVVPNFISEGYFTQSIIPRELELSGRITMRIDGQIWNYCEPVGSHPMMTELLLQRAREVAPGVPERETSLLIVGHGTDLNDNSAVAAKREVEKIRAMNRYAAVLNVYMEEPPLVADWTNLTDTPNVVVVPFFISDGLHSYEDIPVLLGMKKNAFRSVQLNRLHGRELYYANAIGTDPRFADVILEQASAFEQQTTAAEILA